MTEKKETFLMKKVLFVEDKYINEGFTVLVSETRAELDDMTAPFVKKNIAFSVFGDGSAKHIRSAASYDIVELENSFDEKRHVAAQLDLADVAIDGNRVYVRYRYPNGKRWNYWLDTGDIRWDHEAQVSYYNRVDDIPETAKIFIAEKRINSASQGRKDLIYSFWTKTMKEFRKHFNKVTCGETQGRWGRLVTCAQQADYVTRASSHMTFARGRKIEVRSLVVKFGKLDQVDGNCLINEAYFDADEIDKQVRPYTLKGFGKILTADTFEDFLSLLKIKTLIRGQISKEDRRHLNAILNKSASKKMKAAAESWFADYDGVRICDSEDEPVMIIADQNVVKDRWNYDTVDYLRILSEADELDEDQKMSGQLLKIAITTGADNGQKAYAEAMDMIRRHGFSHVDEILFAEKTPVTTLRWDDERFNDTTPIGVVSGSLGLNTNAYPVLKKRVLQDKLQRLGRDILRVNFGIEGLYHPVLPDMAEWLGQTVLKTTAKYVEVYVPGRTGYALLLKYPSTGNYEYIIVKFLSLDEVLARIDALEIDEFRKSIIRRMYESAKEGTIMISSDPIVRHMLAGFDWDGDHALLITDPKFVAFMMKYGHPKAVYIETPETGADQFVRLGAKAFALHKANMSKTGNKRVGQVINMGRFFTDTRNAIKARVITKEQFSLLREFMKTVFFNKNRFHGKKYESPFRREVVGGIEVVHVNNEDVKKMLNQIDNMALSRSNILAWLDDMDYVIRFWSELTIDAQKNLYTVTIRFFKYMRKAGFTLSSNSCGLEFGFVFNEENRDLIAGIEVIDDRVLRDVAPNAAGKIRLLGDTLTVIRRDVAAYTIKCAQKLVDEYNQAFLAANEIKTSMQMEYITNRDELFSIVNLLGRYVWALSRMIRTENAKRIKAVLHGKGKISRVTYDKIARQIEAAVKEDYLYLCKAISNMYRRAAGQYGYSELAERMMAVTSGQQMISAICNQEIMKYFLDQNEIVYRQKIHLFEDVSADMVDEVIYVTDGIAHTSIGQIGRVRVDDGTYRTSIEDNRAYVVEYASLRINIPEVDDKSFVVLIEGSEGMAAIKKHLDSTNEVAFVKRGENVTMKSVDGKHVTVIVNNSFSLDNKRLAGAKLFNDIVVSKTARVLSTQYIDAEYDNYGNLTKEAQVLLVCEEIGAFVPQQQSVKSEAAEIVEAFGDSLDFNF